MLPAAGPPEGCGMGTPPSDTVPTVGHGLWCSPGETPAQPCAPTRTRPAPLASKQGLGSS